MVWDRADAVVFLCSMWCGRIYARLVGRQLAFYQAVAE